MSRLQLIPRTEILPATDKRKKPVTVRYFGPSNTSFGSKIYLCNPEERNDHDDDRTVFAFGGFTTHGSTYVMTYGRSFEDRYETAIEWLINCWPGFSAEDAVTEAYGEARDEWQAAHPGESPDEADECDFQEAGLTDVTITGNGYHIHSDDWGTVVESPTRADLEDLAYPRDVTWDASDGCKHRFPQYRPDRRDYDPSYDHDRAMREQAILAERRLWTDVRVAVNQAHTRGQITSRGWNAILDAIHG